MIKTFLSAIACLSIISCATVSVDEPAVCKTTDFKASSPVDVGNVSLSSVPPISTSTTVNFANTIQKFSDLGEVSIFITTNSLTALSGDLSWAQRITIYVESPNNPQKYPRVLFADQYFSSQSKSVDIEVKISEDKLIDYFLQGDVLMTFEFTPNHTVDNVNLESQLCFDASLKTTKSL